MKNREIVLSVLFVSVFLVLSIISLALPIPEKVIEISAQEKKIITEQYCNVFPTCVEGTEPVFSGKYDDNGCPIWNCEKIPIPIPTVCPSGCTCTEELTICQSEGREPVEVEISSRQETKRLQLKKASENMISIQEGSSMVTTSGKIIIEEKKLMLETTDGNKEIKIMPSVVSETAMNELRLKNYDVVLKEVGKPVYQISGKRDVKIIGIFKSEMPVVSYIDAYTGSIDKTDRPWWGFLATE